jgi:hypothetical protein
MQLPSPSRLMWLLFIGFVVSLAYGLCSAGILYSVTGKADAQRFLVMYIGPFNTLVTLGLIVATALIVASSQNIIPDTIEAAFSPADLSSTTYYENKQRYYSLRRTITFAAEMIVISFAIFHFCHFPLSGWAEASMMVAACAQFGFASYVGRKLRYGGMMLHSLLNVKVRRNLFRERELDIINTTVHIASTLTIIWVYLHVRSYYGGPFLYDSFIGRSAQVFLLLPAVLAVPVLLMFNFFPREVLRKIYDKSIDVEVSSLQGELKGTTLSPFEKRLRLMELGKMYREELRYSLQLTLSDLPIGITIVVMVVEPFIKN